MNTVGKPSTLKPLPRRLSECLETSSLFETNLTEKAKYEQACHYNYCYPYSSRDTLFSHDYPLPVLVLFIVSEVVAPLDLAPWVLLVVLLACTYCSIICTCRNSNCAD